MDTITHEVDLYPIKENNILKTFRELAEQQKETNRLLKETGRSMGIVSGRFKNLAGYLAAYNIVEKFNELGFKFECIAPGGYRIYDESGTEAAEFDILMENGECIITVDIISSPGIQDIEQYIKRLKLLRKIKNNRNDKRKIYGTVTGTFFNKIIKNICFKTGFFVVRQKGGNIKIDMPAGFVPKNWRN